MIRRPVSSSRVASIGWEEGDDRDGTGTLEVEFTSGHLYRYAGVPESAYLEFVGASSPGKHLNAHIIGRFEHQKVSG